MAKAAAATAPVDTQPDMPTGVALLSLIKASETGYLMLTQTQGAEIVSAGFAAIDQNVQLTDADKASGVAPVMLTPLGEAQLAAAPAAKKARGQTTVSAISAVVPPPTGNSRRGRTGTKYPFDELEVGQSFHIVANLETTNPLIAVQSSLSAAREKWSKPVFEADGTTPVMETVEVKTYEKDATTGKIVTDSEGKRVIASTTTEQRQKTEPTRTFVAAAVDASDPEGVGARVWRTA